MKQSPIAMATALVNMARELEDAEKDAARYRWIRANWNEGKIKIPPRLNFDASIDEAMRGKK